MEPLFHALIMIIVLVAIKVELYHLQSSTIIKFVFGKFACWERSSTNW